MQFIRKDEELGSTCFACIYNNKSERQAKRIRKVRPNFKSLDMVEPVLKGKDNCPLCGYIVVGVIDNVFLHEYCLSDGCKFKQKTEVKNVK